MLDFAVRAWPRSYEPSEPELVADLRYVGVALIALSCVTTVAGLGWLAWALF